ncbi:DedA family protein [Flavisphingomonas formosensis]|uniref:DedA family protein n=1 Tax=Flavisphingomonas formosensis TaxID=861534 RepID=UPI0012FB5F80|nr:DedA family protein [Sphingomonas formosensis]
MEAIIADVMKFIAENKAWAGPLLGLLAFGESLAVVGLLIPATALMIAVGGMVGSGIIDPIPVFIWCVVGSVLGDWVSFAIGRRIGPSAHRHWPLNRHKPAVARARLFFWRHGFISILLGRFLGPVRATIPLVAGMMQMKQRSFQLANILSALLWVPALLTPGYLAARSLGPIEEFREVHLIGLAAIIGVATIAGGAIGARVFGAGTRRRNRNRRALSSS